MEQQPESIIIKFKPESNINTRNTIRGAAHVQDNMWKEFTGISVESQEG